MNWKKIAHALLFPHLAVMILLIPVSAAFLVYAMVYLGTESPVAIASYVLAFYTLTVWCIQLPVLIRAVMAFKQKNTYLQIWRADANLRVTVSLYGGVLWNTAYALLQLGMGVWHRTFWFYSLAGYYLSLAVMRFFLLRHTRRYGAGKRMLEELRRYRACGVVFLVMNVALSLIVFFMVYWNRTFHHHEITTIALAAYTFTSFTLAIVSAVKYRRYQSPVYSASKAIGLASAAVSMLTLESTMLTTFGGETLAPLTQKILLGVSGSVISAFIITMAIFMIVRATRKIKRLRKETIDE